MKTKTAFILFPLVLIILISLTPQAFSPALSLPSPGQIADGAPGYDSWIDKEDSVQEFISLADQYGGSYESIGKSSSSSWGGDPNWDIVLFKFGNPNGGTVMVDAYLHPNEFYGYQVLRAVTTWMLSSNDADAVRIRQNNYVLIVPVVAYRFGRTNYNIPSWMTANDADGGDCGVNLNRNFSPSWPESQSHTNGDGYSGEYSDSEKESQALINAWNIYQPRIYWNLHQGSGPMTMCTARTTQAQEDASEVRSLLPSIQSSLGISNGWSFNVGSSYSNGFSKDGGASRGSAGFLTEVRSGWAATNSIKQDMESGNTFKQVKAMFIAMCQAVEGDVPPPPPDEWSITISSSFGGSTNPSGTRMLDVGESLPVSADPDPNYVFTKWRFDGVDYSTERNIVIPSQSSGSSHTLHAVFSGTPTNTLTISSTGSITY